MTLAEHVIRNALNNGKTVELPSLELTMEKKDRASEIDSTADAARFGRAVRYGRTNSTCDHCGRTATLVGVCEIPNATYPTIWLCSICEAYFWDVNNGDLSAHITTDSSCYSSNESDKKAVRAYITRLYRNAEAKSDKYAISHLNVISKILDKMWGDK